MWDVGHNHRGNSGQLRKRFFHGRDRVWIMNGEKTNLRWERDFTFGERSQVWQIQFHCLGFLRHNVSTVGKCHPWAMESFDICKVNFSIRKRSGLRTQLKHLFLGGQCQKDCFAQSSIKERNFNCPDQPVSGVVHSSPGQTWLTYPRPKIAELERKGDCLASSEKPLRGSHRKNPEASQTGFCLQCVVFCRKFSMMLLPLWWSLHFVMLKQRLINFFNKGPDSKYMRGLLWWVRW